MSFLIEIDVPATKMGISPGFAGFPAGF